jgi:two-component system nitrate/nitrite response regulator NarL
MTTLLVADDHPMILTALDSLLSNSDFKVVAHASTGDETLGAIERHDPDMVLLDVRMPGGSGVDVLKALRGKGDQRRVVLLTAEIADGSLLDALDAGVDGVVLKNADPAYLLDCLETVRDGGTWIDPDLKARVKQLESSSDARAALAPREKELIAQVRQGLRNREIAERLGVTEGTVKVYLHAIYEKLGIANRTELAIRADEFVPEQTQPRG